MRRQMGFGRAAAIAIVSIFAGCRTLPAPDAESLQTLGDITAMSFDDGGDALWLSNRIDSRCSLLRLTLAGRSIEKIRALAVCPERITSAGDPAIAPLPRGARSPYPFADDEALAIVPSAEGEAVAKISRGTTVPLTPAFRAIDSFDVAPDDIEIVFSADAGKGFDVGLAPTDGKREIRWIFPDPLPERGVSWAPRGNKVTYRLESAEGTVLRTVHLPTAFQVAIDLPLTTVEALAWEPKAERFAVVLSSINQPPRIELMRYGGEDRQTIYGGEREFDVNVERLGEMLLLAPGAVRYGETVPLVVWTTSEPSFRWNPRFARLHKSAGIASAAGPVSAVDSGFWEAVQAIPWIDKSRIFVIYRKPLPSGVVFPDRVTVFAPSAGERARESITKGRFDLVSVPEQSPERIEAFAAEWIQRYLHARR